MQYYYEGPVCDLCKKIASACDCSARRNTVESPGTDKQQLKAEIAALATLMEQRVEDGQWLSNVISDAVVKMRQLSAV